MGNNDQIMQGGGKVSQMHIFNNVSINLSQSIDLSLSFMVKRSSLVQFHSC